MTFSRCAATTAAGRPCVNRAKHEDARCTQHSATPEARQEQRARLAGKKAKALDLVTFSDDPVRFATECLGISPWSRQADFLRAVAAHDRIALKAGQKVSKSNSLAILMLWFACTRPGGRVFFTNSSERQVQTVNHRELKRIARGAIVPLGIEQMNDTPSRGLAFASGSEILGFATNEEDRWGGLSGTHLMFIVDEASGVPTSLFEAIEGNTAGDNAKLVVCGNPLRPADYFHEAFTTKAASWHTMTISSLESPNVVQGREVIRGLASSGYIARTRENYGDGSPFWQARVLGEFPSQSEYNVVALADVLAAVQRGVSAKPDTSASLIVGLDVGRFGDDESVGTLVRGMAVVGVYVWRNLDGPTLVSRLVDAIGKHRNGDERVRVNVDVIGVGASPYDALGGYSWVDAVAVNVAESPTVEDHYANLRAQLWFEGARWIKTGAIPNDPKLIGELTSPTYSFDMKGNRKVEAKAEVKKRLGRSPDRADSLLLAIGTQHERTTMDSWAEAYSSLGPFETLL